MDDPFSWGKYRMSLGVSLSNAIDMMSGIMSAPDERQLLIHVDRAAKKCGFERVLMGLQWTNFRGDVCHQVLSGYPPDWQKRYAEMGYMAQDPTVAYCQVHKSPLIWEPKIFSGIGSRDLYEEARSFGLSSGLSVPIHEGGGVKSMLSLARDQSLDAAPEEFARIVDAGQILASIAHFAYRRILTAEIQGSQEGPRLTPQETIALRWTARGKSSWETSQLMSIAEATVVFHLKNAMGKLNVVNRPQAVAAAFRMGLLT